MGRLAHRIHAKSAPQAYRAGDKERCGLLCCVEQSLVPGMYRQRLPLIRTPWHHLSIYQHLSSYQSLVFGRYRQACSSCALLGTTSSATKAWSLACIATPAARTHSLAPPQQLSKPGLWHVSPTPAAHTHSLAPPRQLSPRLPSSQFELL